MKALIKRWLWPLTLPLAAVLWLLEPFIHPRFGRVCAERIGHLAANTDLLLRRIRLGLLPPKRAYLLFASGPVANQTLLSLYGRQIPLFVNDLATGLFALCEPWIKVSRFHLELPFESNEYALFDGAPPMVFFTPEEEARGRAGLLRMGIGENDWFVCFFNRDSSYLKARHPSLDYSYHDFRDTKIENFLPAAALVAERGGFAVRMGAQVAEALPAGRSPRVIDYAREHRDDFMDIYLMARCRFAITSDAGLQQVANVFGTPCVNTNAICLDWAGFLASDIFIHKKWFDKKAGRLLSYSEVLERDLFWVLESSEFDRRGISRIENTADEILEAVREMLDRREGRWRPAQDDEALQSAYRGLFAEGRRCHGFRSRVGADFLRRNKDALLPGSLREVPA